jgi:hypothetical protein
MKEATTVTVKHKDKLKIFSSKLKWEKILLANLNFKNAKGIA